MIAATALSIRTASGDDYLRLVEDGFSKEGLVTYLRNEFGDEYPWIETIRVRTLGWTLGEGIVEYAFDDIYKELDKIEG